MAFFVGFIFGIFVGLVSLYFYDHKQNISYALTTLKEDVQALHVKLEKFISLQK